MLSGWAQISGPKAGDVSHVPAGKFKFLRGGGRVRLRTLFPRNSVPMPPREGPQELILVVGSIPELRSHL